MTRATSEYQESTGSAVNESELLVQQAKQAKEAAIEALQNAKKALQQGIDPRITVRKKPILSIGAAALAGFIAVWLAVPSKEERELRRLERLNRAMHPEPPAPSSNGDSKAKAAAPIPPHSIWSTLIHEVIQMIRPILMTAITAGIKSAVSQSTPPAPNSGPDKPF